MTEAEWLACNDPGPMIEFFHGKDRDRKMRLFLVACCRRVWHLLVDNRNQNAVEVAERFAEGLASEEERDSAERAAIDASDAAHRTFLSLITRDENDEEIKQPGFDIASKIWSATCCVWRTTRSPKQLAWQRIGPFSVTAGAAQHAAWAISGLIGSDDPITLAAQAAEEALQCCFLRCIFGNPFRPIVIDPAWLRWQDGTIPHMAQAIYEERTFDRLPILADALEEAGCTDEVILAHCRQPGEHVRGCWVVDALLGRA